MIIVIIEILLLYIFKMSFDIFIDAIVPLVIYLMTIFGTFKISNYIWKIYYSEDPEHKLKSSLKVQKIGDKIFKICSSILVCFSLFSIMLAFDLFSVIVSVILIIYFIVSLIFIVKS
jgi:hypothetical protein